MRGRLWIISELFYPELASTGYIMTQIAKGLAKFMDVNVLCAQPTYHSRGEKRIKYEVIEGIKIKRCWSTTFNKDNLIGRIANLLTISLSIFINCLIKLKKDDKVLVVTNPPSLPFFVSIVSKIKGANCSLLVHDIYPDLLEAVGKMQRGLLFCIFRELNKFMLKKMEFVFVIGRDMKNKLIKDYVIDDRKIIFAPNWADVDDIIPLPKDGNILLRSYNLEGKFIVLYAGNIGYPNDIETIVYAARKLKEDDSVHFIFIGSGTKKRKLLSLINRFQLTNITVLPVMPRDKQNEFLNACDVCLVSLVKGMKGISVPSRTYNIMAAGKPIIAILEKGTEVAYIIDEEKIGWIVEPGNYQNLADIIIEAKKNRENTLLMGDRARKTAEKKYSFERVLHIFCKYLIGFESVNHE